MTAVDRRGFLRGMLVGSGTLALAVSVGGAGCAGNTAALRIEHAEKTGELQASLYITVKPDGRVGLIVNKAEIGQGVTTGYATIVAEELGVPIDHVDVTYADAHPGMRESFNMQITGGSTSTKEAFGGLRHGAAAAREMLIAAAARDWGVPEHACALAEGRVTHAASNRTAGLGELTKRAAHIAVPSSPTPKARKDYTLVGKADRRVDARAKVLGTATFGLDFHLDGAANAYIIHGPQYGAAPREVSGEAAARGRPGVIAVLALPFGVAVVAEKYWQARAAARELAIEWHPGDTRGLDTAQMQAAMRDTFTKDIDDVVTEVVDRGHAEKTIRRAATTASAVYEAPYLAHAAMEPQNATVRVGNGEAEVWAPTQSPTIVQAMVGHALGIDRERVKVHVLLSGGGFGRRAIGDVCAQAAVIAKRVGRPIKLTWTRESDMTQAFYRPVYAVQMSGAATADGRPAALSANCLSQSITLSSGDLIGAALPGIPAALQRMVVGALTAMVGSNSFPDMFSTEGLATTPYTFGDFRVGAAPVQNKLPVCSWRSVGNSVTGFVMESFVDELAHAAKQDPFAFRRAILPKTGKQARVLDALEQLSNWHAPPRPGIGRGMARHFAFETEVGEVAEVELVDGRIKVRRVYCVVDCGVAVNPDIVKAQMEGGILYGLSAALDQEITLVDGVVQQQNFDTFPSLRMFEAPEIIVQIIDSPDEPTGVGEPGLPPAAPAVANAIFALTGTRLRRMPLQRAWNERAAKPAGGAA